MTEPRPKPAFTGPDICAMAAHEVVAMLRKGEISPRELLDAAYARIEAVEPSVNAMPTRCEERAYAAADALNGANADHPGWLAGLPVGIKDLTAVKGVRTTFATRGLADFIPEASDPVVEVLESRGAVVAGKTNTPEFGAGGNTFNDVFGPTLNPWNTTLNAAGSSGGAAASLATGEVWLSHGSDHGGSLRTPAAFCGVVGLRPSPGRAVDGPGAAGFLIEPLGGPMARSTRDCALFLDAMSGFEPRVPFSFPTTEAPFQQAVEQADGRVKIAFTPDLGGFSPVDAEVEAHLRGALAKLEGNGATIEETCPDLPNLERAYRTLRGVSMAALGLSVPESISKHFKATLKENIAKSRTLTAEDVARATIDRTVIYNNMLALYQRFDVLACPTVGCLPHPQTEEWVREVGGQTLTDYMDWLRFAFLSTTTGLPAISVPAGIGPRGLPVGIQLIGKPRGEAGLLKAARAVEVAVGGPLGPIDPVIG